MGKEVKKVETKKSNAEAGSEKPKSMGMEKKPKEDGKGKKEKARLPLPPPPEELEMRVYMHCEGCAKKVKKILRNFDGVEDMIVDFETCKVVVKGKKVAANPMKVVAHVHKKTRHRVELVSPTPSPPEEKKEEKKEEPEPPKPEEKEPLVMMVVLKVHIHCKVCAQWITKRILRMKGVQSAEPDIAASKVTVKGVFEEARLPQYVYRCTGKHVTIIKSEPSAPSESVGGDGKIKEKKKKAEGCEEKKEGSGNTGGKVDKEDMSAITAANMYLYYPQFAFPDGYYPPPPPSGYVYQSAYPPQSYAAYTPRYQTVAPQIFSDENPNVCSVM